HVADLDDVALVERQVNLARGHGQVDILCRDASERYFGVAGLQRCHAGRVGADAGLDEFPGLRQSLDVVRVGVGGNQQLAAGQVEVHLPNQVDDLGHRVLVADIDQEPFPAAVD